MQLISLMPYLVAKDVGHRIVFVDFGNKKVYASDMKTYEEPDIAEFIFNEIEKQSTNLSCSIEVPKMPYQILEQARHLEGQSLEKIKEARGNNAF